MPFDVSPAPQHVELSPEQRVLLRAADEVDRGWCRFALEDKEGRVCAMGAIGRAATGCAHGDDDLACAARNLLRAHIDTEFIGVWNNNPQRTAAEVAAALRQAAA